MKKRARKPKIVSLLFIAVFLFLSPSSSSAEDMSNLVSSLFGGDGVNLLSGAHQGHFTVATTDAINELSAAISDGSRQFPLSSSGGGFTFEYDPQRDLFVRTSKTLGPILAERGQTLGKGKIITGFSHTIINFNRFEGKSTSSLRLIAEHQPEVGDPDFAKDVVTIDIDLSVRTRVDAFYFTYGLTNRLDVGVFIPLLSIDIEADALATLEDSGGGPVFHQFGPPGDRPSSSVEGRSSGLGDVLVRLKYLMFKGEKLDFAVDLDIKAPTGNKEDLLGTGETTVKSFLVFSRSHGKINPHLNLGYEYETGDGEIDRDTIRYALGLDMAGSERVTLAVDIVGSESLDSSRVGGRIIDGAVGLKFSPDTDFLFVANLIFPLNSNTGLRADFTPTIGFEAIF